MSGYGYSGSELQLQKYVVQLLQRCGRPDVLWLAIPNGEARSPITGARLKAMGVKPGAADLLIIIEGNAHWLELKSATGRLSAAQKAFLHAVDCVGGFSAVASSPEQARDVLTEWGALRMTSATNPRSWSRAGPGSRSGASGVRHLASYPVDVEQDPSTGSGQAMEDVVMAPPKSEAQRKLFRAAGASPQVRKATGISKKVAAEYNQSDPGGKLPKRVGPKKPRK